MFKEFQAAGLAVIPLRQGVPLVQWSPFFYTLPTAGEAALFSGSEYGLICGKASGVIGVDIDTDDTQRIYALAGDTPVRKRGAKGFTAFYRFTGEATQNWKTPAGQVICEILSNKHLTTIPPSNHRKTGKPYVWLDQPIIGAELPVLNDDFVLFMDAKYPKIKSFTVSAPRAVSDYDKTELQDVEAMLSYISPDCTRDEWVQIGMALRDEFGDAVCHIWHGWSSTGGKYKHNDAQSAWRSFSNDGVTIATLVYFAKRGGWRPQSVSLPVAAKAAEQKPEPQRIVVGGIVGEIANWITETAIRPQPELSLAAALSFVAAMKGHRVQSSIRGARTNLLILSFSSTGGGKDYPQEAIQRLIKRCGLDSMIMGRPTSGTGMLTGLNKAGGIGWLKVDEMGRYLSNASGKQAASHQREIIDYMIELYSCANRTFYGRQYANDKENPQVIIEHPHFCCIGSTVEEKMREACKSGEVIDGFLNRWLIFNSKTRPKKDFSAKDFAPPEALIKKITDWMNNFPITRDTYGEICPQTISLTPEAWDLFLAYEETIEATLDVVKYPLNNLYARAGEQVIKTATAITDDMFVGTQEILTAIQIVDASIKSVLEFAGNISDNQHEQNVVYVMDVIRHYPDGIAQNDITRKTRHLNNRDRTEILNQLIEAGNVRVTKEGKRNTFWPE